MYIGFLHGLIFRQSGLTIECVEASVIRLQIAEIISYERVHIKWNQAKKDQFNSGTTVMGDILVAKLYILSRKSTVL